MATIRTPAERIRASRRCRSGASGVVRASSTGLPSIRAPFVPMTPARDPDARMIASRRYVVVVLPFVPVIPIVVSASAGRPKITEDIGPIAARTDGTNACGASSASHRSTTSPPAPAASASGAKR